MACKSFLSSFADLMSLMIRGMEAMSQAFILKVCFSILKSILFYNNAHIGGLEFQFAPKNSVSNSAAAERVSTQHCLGFAEDAARLLVGDQVQSQGPKLLEVKVACADACGAQADVKFNVLWLTAPESVLQSQIAQLTLSVGKL